MSIRPMAFSIGQHAAELLKRLAGGWKDAPEACALCEIPLGSQTKTIGKLEGYGLVEVDRSGARNRLRLTATGRLAKSLLTRIVVS